jgi:hypothetical protein
METEIISIIEKGKHIKRTIAGMVTKYEYPQGDKNSLLIAYHSILAEHHGAIHLLIENQLYGSAFALVRAFYEPLYRAHWVNACATEKQIEEIIKGKDIPPDMKTMVEEIDLKYGTGSFWQVVKKNSWTAMNDYTHSGMRQIARRFVRDEVEPNYDVVEIKEVLDGTNVALLLMALFFFNVYKKPDEIKAVEKMILEYNKA